MDNNNAPYTMQVISEKIPVQVVSTFALSNDTSRFITFAKYSCYRGLFVLEYTEYGSCYDDDTAGVALAEAPVSDTGYGDNDIRIAAASDIIEITRTGDSAGTIVIERGRKHYCNYGTPYGQLTVGVTADKLEVALAANGGKIYTEYTLDLNGSMLSQVALHITVGEYAFGD